MSQMAPPPIEAPPSPPSPRGSSPHSSDTYSEEVDDGREPEPELDGDDSMDDLHLVPTNCWRLFRRGVVAPPPPATNHIYNGGIAFASAFRLYMLAKMLGANAKWWVDLKQEQINNRKLYLVGCHHKVHRSSRTPRTSRWSSIRMFKWCDTSRIQSSGQFVQGTHCVFQKRSRWTLCHIPSRTISYIPGEKQKPPTMAEVSARCNWLRRVLGMGLYKRPEGLLLRTLRRAHRWRVNQHWHREPPHDYRGHPDRGPTCRRAADKGPTGRSDMDKGRTNAPTTANGQGSKSSTTRAPPEGGEYEPNDTERSPRATTKPTTTNEQGSTTSTTKAPQIPPPKGTRRSHTIQGMPKATKSRSTQVQASSSPPGPPSMGATLQRRIW